MIKRFDRLDVATSDLADAARIYQEHFGFKVTQQGEEAIVAVGNAQIRLRAGAAVADLITSTGEGLAAVWLETDDVEKTAARLGQAGVKYAPIRTEGDRRILGVEPASANMVSLYIFDRKTA